MILFSIAAVLLSALAAALILQRASGAARRTDADPTLVVYRRQLSEIDDLAERGLLAGGELKAARAEAARRLLGAAEKARAPAEPGAAPKVSRGMRLTVLAGALITPVLAVGLYLTLGTPGASDQPFASRLKDWTQSDPSQLTAPQMAAVLQTVVKARPNDAEPLTYLARAQAASGDVAAAAETMRKAIRLEPKVAELWANLGILRLMQGQGEETQPAQDAFRQALALDPKNAPARYHLARAKIAAGDLDGGLADWRALSADLPAGDPQRTQLDAEIAAVQKAGHLVTLPEQKSEPPQQQAEAGAGGGVDPGALAGALTGQAPAQPPAAAAGGGDQRAFINSMVQRLAERLRRNPDDPAGWARLIRSYAVLGDQAKMQGALDQAHQIFRNQPEALKTVDNAMSAPQGTE